MTRRTPALRSHSSSGTACRVRSKRIKRWRGDACANPLRQGRPNSRTQGIVVIISASTDYREAARRRLPPFLFHYADGGANAEYTMGRNISDLAEVALKQRVLK